VLTVQNNLSEQIIMYKTKNVLLYDPMYGSIASASKTFLI